MKEIEAAKIAIDEYFFHAFESLIQQVPWVLQETFEIPVRDLKLSEQDQKVLFLNKIPEDVTLALSLLAYAILMNKPDYVRVILTKSFLKSGLYYQKEEITIIGSGNLFSFYQPYCQKSRVLIDISLTFLALLRKLDFGLIRKIFEITHDVKGSKYFRFFHQDSYHDEQGHFQPEQQVTEQQSISLLRLAIELQQEPMISFFSRDPTAIEFSDIECAKRHGFWRIVSFLEEKAIDAEKTIVSQINLVLSGADSLRCLRKEESIPMRVMRFGQ